MGLRETFSYMLSAGFDIMSAAISTVGSIVVQIGDAATGTVDSDVAEWWQHTGFRSFPEQPTNGSASCQGIAVRRGDHDMVFATKDERSSSCWSDFKYGDAEIYSYSGKCRVVVRGSANGSKVQIFANAGDVDIDVSAGNGNVNVNAGSGTVNLTTTGTVNVGGNGSTVNLGGGGHPIPLADVIDSFVDVFLTAWVPVPNDGGAALKTALTSWAAGPPVYTSTGSTHTNTSK